jgi:hypothetical protein
VTFDPTPLERQFLRMTLDLYHDGVRTPPEILIAMAKDRPMVDGRYIDEDGNEIEYQAYEDAIARLLDAGLIKRGRFSGKYRPTRLGLDWWRREGPSYKALSWLDDHDADNDLTTR